MRYLIRARCEDGTIYFDGHGWHDDKAEAKRFNSYGRAKLILNRLLFRRGLQENPWWFGAAIIEVEV